MAAARSPHTSPRDPRRLPSAHDEDKGRQFCPFNDCRGQNFR